MQIKTSNNSFFSLNQLAQRNTNLFRLAVLCSLLFLAACSSSRKNTSTSSLSSTSINPGKTSAADLVAYAKSLEGTRYCYGSTDPSKGLDCSGFVFHVFNHFGIKVPRSTSGYSTMGPSITLRESHPGDLILFTGSNASNRTPGHIGIISENNRGTILFIHASSSSKKAVTISGFSSYFSDRFLKVIRVF